MKFRLKPLLMASLTTVIILFPVFLFNLSERRHYMDKNRKEALHLLSEHRSRLEGALNQRLYLMRGLVAYVSRHPDISEKEFQRLAKELIGNDVAIRNMTLAKDSVISHIYPLEGNEAALGLDLLAHPEQGEALKRAIETGKVIVAGPVDLVQGGVAFIGRTPIFLMSRDKSLQRGAYWGQASVVIMLDKLFDEAGLSEESENLRFVLRGKDGLGSQGDAFWGDEKVLQSAPVLLDVTLPNGSWQLGAIPKGGWSCSTPQLWFLLIGGIILSLVTGAFVFVVAREPLLLRKEIEKRNRMEKLLKKSKKELEIKVEERTAELRNANEELRKENLERKKAEEDLRTSREQLRNLSEHLQSASEEERKNVAREVHDELGQALTALKIDVSLLGKKLPVSQDMLNKRVESMLEIINSTIRSVKRIAKELRPELLDDLGLAAAIEWYAKEFQNRSTIKCDVKIECDDNGLDQRISIALFRVFQESMTNILRHADATRVKVYLGSNEGALFLKVSDNGVGIKKSQIADARSTGLIGMRERIRFLGGEVRIRGVRGMGSTVNVSIPTKGKA